MERYRCEVVLREWESDDRIDCSLKDFIRELSELLNEDPDAQVSFVQYGDSWDGYDSASLKIFRHETDAEIDRREEGDAAKQIAAMRERERIERLTLQALKQKYGETS